MRDHLSAHNTPGWVKISGTIVIALLLLFVSVHLIVMGLLGHASGGHDDHAPPSSATEHDPQRP